MRIAFVSSGNSIHVKKLANALIDRGYQITLYTLPDYNKLLSDFDKRVKIVKLPFSGKKGYYLNVPYLRKCLKKEQYDLVNCHYASGNGMMTRLTGIHPFVLSVFGSDVYDYPFKSKANMRRIIKNLESADVITSTSHVMVEKIREFYLKEKKIYVTPFGVDLERFYPRKVEVDIFQFGIVKKIEYQYGIDILIHAFKAFREEIQDTDSRLVIYGRGSALEECRQMVIDMGIRDYVDFKGFIQNELVPEALCQMDAACFPSIRESFGVAAVEAMACGIPVIASDAAGFTEVIEDGITGYLVPKNNVAALKDAMIKMYYLSKEQRMAMGEKGRERVVKRYDFHNNVLTYMEAINHALEKK